MKYYRHNQQVYAFESDGSQDDFIPAGAVLMSAPEVQAHLAAPSLPSVPAAVSRFQAKAALLEAGLLPAVEASMASASALAKLAWAEAVEFRRDSPTVASMAQALGLSSLQVDALFIAASRVTA